MGALPGGAHDAACTGVTGSGRSRAGDRYGRHEMILTSAGAARMVTGSCHHLQAGDLSILVDCGLFQGGAEVRELNHEPFPFDPAELDAVLVTHGHLDHVGRLPLLLKKGYRGRIHCTTATANITAIILRDSAKIAAEDHEREMRKARRAGSEDEVRPPLYDLADVEKVVKRFTSVEMGEPLKLPGGVSVLFRPAGHILGSAYLEVTTRTGRVTFSGDLGNRESALQATAAAPNECDVMVIETTYADRTHPARAVTEAEFERVLKRSFARGGNVMIPAFALERTQQVLYLLKNEMASGSVERRPVYLDSPMATHMTRLYQSCANEFRPKIAEELERGVDPFEPESLVYTVSRAESQLINDVEGGAVILAGSGMMTGGRIVHHLKHNLWREEASLVIVGYQAHGTLGRALQDGAKRVRILGDEIAVRAEIVTISGFSAHADHDDLMAFITPSGAGKLLLVHGESEVMDAFAKQLREGGHEAQTPYLNEPLNL